MCQDIEQKGIQSSEEVLEARVYKGNHQRVHYARKLRTVEEVSPLKKKISRTSRSLTSDGRRPRSHRSRPAT